MKKKTISDGVYLVIDPLIGPDKILSQLKLIKNEKIAAIQIWNNPKTKDVAFSLIENIIALFENSATPILINNNWQLLKTLPLDGVHFDEVPKNLSAIEAEISRPFIKGLTLQNDLMAVEKDNNLKFDYLSFCSLFPSLTAKNCEIVSFETIKKCRQRTTRPIFLAGGIRLDNMASILQLPANGIAVVSAVMNASNPLEVIQKFNSILKRNHEVHHN